MATTAESWLLTAVQASSSNSNYRLGQAMYNLLPPWASEWVTGEVWDPYYKDLTAFDAMQWIEDHLVFDDKGLAAIYSGDTILATREDK